MQNSSEEGEGTGKKGEVDFHCSAQYPKRHVLRNIFSLNFMIIVCSTFFDNIKLKISAFTKFNKRKLVRKEVKLFHHESAKSTL